MNNTRFNPTTNGPLHLGHLLMALVNEHEAHASGGRFIVRFDDTQPQWLEKTTPDVREVIRRGMMTDLSQYVEVDHYRSQELYTPITQQFLEGVFHMCLPRHGMLQPFMPWTQDAPDARTYDPDVPEVPSDLGLFPFPYSPYLIAETVYFDYVDQVNWLIRGMDLLDQFSLYAFFRENLNLSTMRQTYLPRLVTASGEPISKTIGGHTIHEATAKYGPYGILEKLRTGCLVDPDGPFAVANIRKDPRWIE